MDMSHKCIPNPRRGSLQGYCSEVFDGRRGRCVYAL